MITFPNAKINLGLNIVEKREDGYHNIETLFYPINLRDCLEIVPARGKTELHLSGLHLEGGKKDNLVWKAYEVLTDAFPDKITPIDIYLHKTIPTGGGLGGGSSDGAYMLSLLNEYFSLGLSTEQLVSYALKLGSDCPFFIHNAPQYASGRGEFMEPVLLDLSAFCIQLVCPDVHVSTHDAYKHITPKPAPADLRNLVGADIMVWRDEVTNDFEGEVFAKHPELAELKEELYKAGAIYASMTGSGSALYGIFEKGKKAAFDSDVKQFLL